MWGPKCEKVRKSWVDSEIHTSCVLLLTSAIFVTVCVLRSVSLLWKEERVTECLMFWGKFFQLWGPKYEKVRKHLC